MIYCPSHSPSSPSFSCSSPPPKQARGVYTDKAKTKKKHLDNIKLIVVIIIIVIILRAHDRGASKIVGSETVPPSFPDALGGDEACFLDGLAGGRPPSASSRVVVMRASFHRTQSHRLGVAGRDCEIAVRGRRSAACCCWGRRRGEGGVIFSHARPQIFGAGVGRETRSGPEFLGDVAFSLLLDETPAVTLFFAFPASDPVHTSREKRVVVFGVQEARSASIHTASVGE